MNSWIGGMAGITIQGNAWVTSIRRGGASADLTQVRYLEGDLMVMTTTITSWKVKPRGDISVDERVVNPSVTRRFAP